MGLKILQKTYLGLCKDETLDANPSLQADGAADHLLDVRADDGHLRDDPKEGPGSQTGPSTRAPRILPKRKPVLIHQDHMLVLA